MDCKQIKGKEIEGLLDVFFSDDKDQILIHGNSEGLKSLAQLLMKLAELDQEKIDNNFLPSGSREHYELRPNIELSKSSIEVIVGRLDARGTGEFYSRYIPKDN
ncbi:hypothetical protein [Chryseobacterium sp.]|uniref:Imm32 family immunity protein n=1 Tax=Chryseobacterium sp. TaxID=1871047 RepID=UPI0026384E9E|nr:hypothetical protein [Chryseobacterium sp.]